jgi:photosystem II stability/assembly factor-like uncharacterized protein
MDGAATAFGIFVGSLAHPAGRGLPYSREGDVKSTLVLRRSALLTLALAGFSFAACDDDPSAPLGDFPGFSLDAVPDTLGVQQAIKVVFDDSISAATALDRANFVVTNLCTGLGIPGAIRLSGDTLIFTPSQSLPFLTLLGIRIQNLLTPSGRPMTTPITFQRITAPPPIRDQTWRFLDSPTNDALTGVSFVNDLLGYIAETGGTVYRTTDGGQSFVARFKDINLTTPSDIRAFGPDTVFMVASRRVGTATVRALFRSVNGGETFETAAQASEFLFVNSMRRVAGVPEGVFGGILASPGIYRYFGATNTATRATGHQTSGWLLTAADLSPDANRALATFRGLTNAQLGAAALSLDGGLTYSPLTLPANVYSLSAAGFVDNTTALVAGDSSVVLRFDASTAAPTFTLITAGIPQTERDATTGEITAYTFGDIRFVPGTTTGWMTGFFVRRRPGTPDVQGGVILQSDDGGVTWRRQAIATALENGLAFSPVFDLQALRRDFAAVVGRSGLVAARTDTVRTGLTACSLNTP